MATSARDLLTHARHYAERLDPPDWVDAEAAIAALRYAGRELTRVADAAAQGDQRWSPVNGLARVCVQTTESWDARPGRLTDLVGAACDVLGREDVLHDDERWTVAVHITQAARRCIEVALRHPPYAQIPTLRLAHSAAVAVEQVAALHPPEPAAGAVLDRPVPGQGDTATGLLDAFGSLHRALRRDAADGPVSVAAVLATATVAEQIARACTDLTHTPAGTPAGTPADAAARAAPSGWRAVQAALSRFDDGSRRRNATPTPTVDAARSVHDALTRAQAEPILDRHTAATVRLLAAQLPSLARDLTAAATRWANKHTLYGRARDLQRRDDRVPALLTNAVVRADEPDLLPVLTALTVARRLSAALSATTPTNRATLADDARWADRIAHHADHIGVTNSPTL